MKNGFTLVEMLVVIGIIGILTGASIVGYNSAVLKAENSRAQELVHNAATALTACYQSQGYWPTAIIEGADAQKLDENAVLPLAKKSYLSMNVGDDGKLAGFDRFGLVTPWAQNVIKSRGKSVSLTTPVGNTKAKIEDHILRYAIDDDDDGLVEVNVNGASLRVRASACVWCCPKTGSTAWKDMIKSWTSGQEKR